jgi:GNAT superfamily N-acetyltransferase
MVIRTIEELSMNAWPALHTVLHRGWVLRFSGGYTRRANSVNPLYPMSGDLAENVAACERLYRDRRLPPVYKLTADSCPAELDAFLAGCGYSGEAHTSVQLLDLRDWSVPAEAPVELFPVASEEWFRAYCCLAALAPAHQPLARRMLGTIVPEARFAAIRRDGEVVACGLGVAQSGYVGLFDVVTDGRYRRRGYGRGIVAALLDWAGLAGAHTAYLQVMCDNDPALRLYAGLGFEERYRYWYRVLRTESSSGPQGGVRAGPT